MKILIENKTWTAAIGTLMLRGGKAGGRLSHDVSDSEGKKRKGNKKKKKKKKSIAVSKVNTVTNVSSLSAHKDGKETIKKGVFFLLSPSAVQQAGGLVLR